MSTPMIDGPALIQIDLKDGAKLTQMAARYTDPTEADIYGTFAAVGNDGGTHYVLWAAIVRLSVFPNVARDAA